ncbi:MAG TPA: cytochrome c biogenesis protein CcdA [Chloroflexota bacterium]|nr:cytochrome c biogenesis protein CcdA [Chloroflexota bacterium]
MSSPTFIAIAFGAGLVSFLSPCTLPLLPGYLSYISGIGVDDLQTGRRTTTVLGPALLFVLGFSLVFVALGATTSYIGALIQPYHAVLQRVAGAFIILMALLMIGLFQFPGFYRELRFHPGRDFGPLSALPLGMAFAFGWTPCIGPVLASISVFAATAGNTQRGALLLFAYAMGMGLPFLAAALFAGRAFDSFAWARRRAGILNLAGGAILLVMGVFLLLDRWTQLLAPAMRWYADLHIAG